jgi:hypothetical protein
MKITARDLELTTPDFGAKSNTGKPHPRFASMAESMWSAFLIQTGLTPGQHSKQIEILLVKNGGYMIISQEYII